MRLPTPAFRVLLALVVCAGLEAAPRSSSTANTKETGDAPAPSPVLSRRIVTKVDGVVVEDYDTAVQGPISLNDFVESSSNIDLVDGPPPPPLSHESVERVTPRAPDGVVYGEVVYTEDGDQVALDEEIAPEAEAETTPATEETSDDSFFGSMFGNFFSPERDASSNRMRSGKGRSQYLAPEGEPAPDYGPVVVAEPLKESPFIAPSRNLIVGEIVSVDREQGIAVAWMQSRFIALERNVITRNHELETTAVLRPTTYRNGRAYGLDIAVGEPHIGDEVVLSDAGPAMRRQDDLTYNVSLTVEPSAQN